ncbi:hypothetical protein LZT27_18710 [Aeromonas veronii]|uniref:hypothetical protein n=1 Tax=Aeromonas veronii TaxID=654 RepID=UPI002363A068|nr:hypothetical protein [Aeromonas veronii]MDD1846608.1 hypothetical protein [Aeromonas veronii]
MEITNEEWMAVSLAVTMMKGLPKYNELGQLVKAQYESASKEEQEEFIQALLGEIESASDLLQSAAAKLKEDKPK